MILYWLRQVFLHPTMMMKNATFGADLLSSVFFHLLLSLLLDRITRLVYYCKSIYSILIVCDPIPFSFEMNRPISLLFSLFLFSSHEKEILPTLCVSFYIHLVWITGEEKIRGAHNNRYYNSRASWSFSWRRLGPPRNRKCMKKKVQWN